jgi:hypothetical protein
MNRMFAHASHADVGSARRVFACVFVLTLLVKLLLAAFFPITGDEAFFYQWGVFPDWGYSDHPPMVGWLLYVLNSVSAHPLSIRFFTVLLWSLIALGLVDLIRRLDQTRESEAWWLGSLFLLLPFSWALNIVTTDTPLIFFVFLSGYCFVRGNLSGRTAWYIACGVFLGCGLLSKYFAGLLALAYFAYLCRSPRNWPKLVLIAACSVPFFAINMVFNADHCWTNIMFNLINRNEKAHWSAKTVIVYVAMMIYLITPWVSWRLLRTRQTMLARGALAVLFVVPFALFLLLSMKKQIGLHWVLGFMPFVFLFVGTACSAQELRKYAKWTAWYAVPHLLALAAIIVLPASVWKGGFHEDVVFHRDADKIVAALRSDLPRDGIVMGRAYNPISILSYHARDYWPVFGEGRFHARQDDLIVDFRNYAGKTIRIFDREKIEPAELAPYFSSVTVHSFIVDGVTFWYADGQDFNYPVYRERILKAIADHYYRIPSFLPMTGCPFLERYDLPRPS